MKRFISFVLVAALLLTSCAKIESIRPPGNNGADASTSYQIPDYSYAPNGDRAANRALAGLDTAGMMESIVCKWDDKLYFTGSRPDLQNTLFCLDLPTGVVSYVCPDPLCRHDNADCPFYGACSGIYIYEDTIYYKVRYSAGVYDSSGKFSHTSHVFEMRAFNLETGNLRVVLEFDFDASTTNQQYYDGTDYYWYDFAKAEDEDMVVNTLCRTDLLTGETVVQKQSQENYFADQLLFVRDGSLWQCNKMGLYRTDAETLENRETVMTFEPGTRTFARGDQILLIKPENDYWKLSVLDPVSLREEEIGILNQTPSDWMCFTDSGVFYTLADDTVEITVNQKPKSIKNHAVWYFPLSQTGEPSLAYVFPEEQQSMSIVYAFISDGGYLYFYYSCCEQDENGASSADFYYSANESCFMRVDLSTGEQLKIGPPVG